MKNRRILDGCKIPQKSKDEQMSGVEQISEDENSIKIENLNFFYGEKQVLKNVNINLNRGEFVCLCGPNGSGKSTLLRTIESRVNSNQKIAAFLQQSEFCAWDTSVLNLILSGRFAFCKGRYTDEDFKIVEEAAETLKIGELLERSVYSLSGGEFQKVRIARTLAQNTEYLILDEPCANLDFSVVNELLSFFKSFAANNNKNILISIHDLNAAARFADFMEILTPLKKNPCGGLQRGRPEDVFKTEILEPCFGDDVKIFTHPIYKCPQIC